MHAVHRENMHTKQTYFAFLSVKNETHHPPLRILPKLIKTAKMTSKTIIFRYSGLLGIVLLLIAFGCKKDETGSSDDYFIKSNVNGVLVNATYTLPNSDLVSNAYDSEYHMFQIERGISASSSQGWNIIIRELDLDAITYPTTLTYSDHPDMDILYNNGTSGAQGNFLLDDYETNPFSITLDSWSDDILEGTFEGKLRWGGGSDSTTTINDGEFRIKMIRY
jgi:hypothetical protein